MSRNTALIKLLALGSLHYSDILQIMGGNRDEAVSSLEWLVENGVVVRGGSNMYGVLYSLACEL